MPACDQPPHIGALIFPNMTQLDFTGPFEVFATIPGAKVHVLWKDTRPIRDTRGLILTPEETLAAAPDLDVLLVPGGFGQEDLMDDEEVLSFVVRKAATARFVFSVCTGALILGAAGLLRGRRATTHWASFDLLPYFGAIPVDERVVVDGNLITAAGVSSGIDGALRVAAMLCGERTAQAVQLSIQYAPEPPFTSGSPHTAPADLVQAGLSRTPQQAVARLATAKRFAEKFGVK